MRIDPRRGLRGLGSLAGADAAPLQRDAARSPYRSDERVGPLGVASGVPLRKVLTAPPRPARDRLNLSDAWRRNRYTSPLLDLLAEGARPSVQELRDASGRLGRVLDELRRRGLSDHPQARELDTLRRALADAEDRARRRQADGDPTGQDPDPGAGQDPITAWLDLLRGATTGTFGSPEAKAQLEAQRQAARQAEASRHLQDARAALGAGDRPRALARLRQAIARDPEQPAANGLLGRLLLEDGDADGAELPLRRAIPARPSDPRLRLALGESLYRQGKRDEARQTFTRATEVAPRHAGPPTWLGVMAYEDADLDGATRRFEQAISLDPGNAAARFYLAQIAYRHNDPLRAEYQLLLVQRLDPEADVSRFFDGRPALHQDTVRPGDRGAYARRAWGVPRDVS